MRNIPFGKSGLKVSELGLGTLNFGSQVVKRVAKSEARKMVGAYLAAGGNFFDLDNEPELNLPEKWVGEFVKNKRSKVVLATKYGFSRKYKSQSVGGSSSQSLKLAIEQSLQNLGTNYIDIMWLHAWDGVTPLEEISQSMDSAVRSGLVRCFGVSNTPAWAVARLQTINIEKRRAELGGLQLRYNLLDRAIEPDFLDMARELNLMVTAWSPLGRGLLARRSQALDSSAIGKELLRIAKKYSATMAQVALAWLRQHSKSNPVVAVIGASNQEQLQENLDSLSLVLTTADLAQLDSLTQPPKFYPHDLLNDHDIKKRLKS